MADRVHIGLDNPAFRGRLRPVNRSAPSFRAASMAPPQSRQYPSSLTQTPTRVRPVMFTPTPQQRVAPTPIATPVTQVPPVTSSPLRASSGMPTQSQPAVVSKAAPMPRFREVAQPVVAAASLDQQQLLANNTLARVAEPRTKRLAHKLSPRRALTSFKGYNKLQYTLVGMAGLIFASGILVTLSTLKTNQDNTKKVTAIVHAVADAPAGTAAAAPPSTTPPSSKSVSSYTVGPNMPRYLDIPKLSVHARVLSLGMKNDGSLATPGNVFDVGWYDSSSLPGQPGAVLLDGHVSSWTTHGVFYGIKTLVAGDTVQITRGDGTVFTYKVIRTQTYDSDSVDMNAAMNPVTLGKPGLNLITCTGKVKPGTSEFNQRVMVFTEQV